MSLEGLHSGSRAVITSDSALSAWVLAQFGKALTVIEGNAPTASISVDKLPVLVMEAGDGEPESANLGGSMERPLASIEGAIVWSTQDRATAYTQQKVLPDLLVQAFMRNRTLSGAVGSAGVAKWTSDRGVNHPTHVLRFIVQGEYDLTV